MTDKHVKYLIFGPFIFGFGDTIDEAIKNCKKQRSSRSKFTASLWRITANQPFFDGNWEGSPPEGESDCWVASDGSIQYWNCDADRIGELTIR